MNGEEGGNNFKFMGLSLLTRKTNRRRVLVRNAIEIPQAVNSAEISKVWSKDTQPKLSPSSTQWYRWNEDDERFALQTQIIGV
jgi:hypothetical protein